MKSAALKTAPTQIETFSAGLYSKKDAVFEIISGKSHLHSSNLGNQDPLARETFKALQQNRIPTYAWEATPNECLRYRLTESSQRACLIDRILSDLKIQRRALRERGQLVMEELLTNAVYHSYHTTKGAEKYHRRDHIKLTESEGVQIDCKESPEGIFVRVIDTGGTLEFNHIQAAFKRCYGNTQPQIEEKEGGAGLGFYMIYENASHLKFCVDPKRTTEISCFFRTKPSQDIDNFTFNFFTKITE